MALSKDRIPRDSSKVQTFVDETAMKITSLTSQRVNECNRCMHEEEDGSQSTNGVGNDSVITHSPRLCGSGSGNGYVYKSTSYQLGTESLIDFQANEYNNLMQGTEGSESLFNFQQSFLVSNENNLHQGYYYNQWNHISPRSTTDCFQSASAYRSIVRSAEEKQHGESLCEWLYAEYAVPGDSLQESSSSQESFLKKRSSMGEKMLAAKKPCTSKTAKPKSNQSKDPRSVAAQNRRERISERLKILQELVPNGSKVDLVTMLEKAISYVKFLQLQVKVLAADEFWPVQGGKAPDISQVRHAIDAILSSQ